MANLFYHKDLTDFQWNKINFLFPKAKKVEKILQIVNKDVGSSRGGKNTKIHVLVNERMQMLNVVLTGGQVHDSEKAMDLFEKVSLEGKNVLADNS